MSALQELEQQPEEPVTKEGAVVEGEVEAEAGVVGDGSEVMEAEGAEEGVVAYEQAGPYPHEIPTLLTHSPEEVVWWYPDLMRDAFSLIDPNSVGARSWRAYHESVRRLTPDHSFYVFYHDGNIDRLRSAWRRTIDEEFMKSEWYYYPVRYDVSQGEDAVIVVGTWPLGETWEIQVRDSDGGFRGRIRDKGPEPPPLAPLPPFTEPDYPEHADALGRNCASVEVLWVESGRVTDPCTLKALETAMKYAVAASTVDQTEAAIRDGWALRDVIRERKDIFEQWDLAEYWNNPDNPGHSTVDIRYVGWEGTHAQASRIHLEFRRYQRPARVTPEFRDKLNARTRELLEAGEDVNEIWLGEHLPEETPGWWDKALMVRTADGTWRMSYSFWCRKMESSRFWGIEGMPLDCPEDPNPVWADDLFDRGLRLPSSSFYWRYQTEAQLEYYGQPPS